MASKCKVSYDIIDRAFEGDNEAISLILEAYMMDIRKCVWKRAGNLSSACKEDVVQEACIEIVKVIRQKKGKFII